jgi:hypothetical protein
MRNQLLLVIFIASIFVRSNAQQQESFKDSRDGRVYKTVKIGAQVWMAENLNTDRFRNGDLIPEAKTEEEWKFATENKKPVGVILTMTQQIGKNMANFTTGML